MIKDTIRSILSWLAEGKGNIVVDSRNVKPGDIFVATVNTDQTFYRGAEDTPVGGSIYVFNSNKYTFNAISKGAHTVIISEHMIVEGEGVNIIEVSDGIAFLGALFREVLERDSKFVIGVTGSTGKSTLTEMIRIALGKDKTYKHLSNRPTPISIPVKALNDPDFYSAKNVAIEMPMDGLGQIKQLCALASPDVGVILNINSSHIVQLGSIEKIVQAKMEMAVYTKLGGVVVINGDDPWLKPEIAKLRQSGKNVLVFGNSDLSDIKIEQVNLAVKGMHVRLTYKDETSVIRSPYVGFSVALSLAAAVGVGVARGEALSILCERLSLMEALPSRMSILEGKKGEIIFDDTRLATPQSTQAILKDLIALKGEAQRMFLIQGPIFRFSQHGSVDQQTVELMKQFNQVILYGDGSWLPSSLPEMPDNFLSISNAEDLTEWYDKDVVRGDLVVFKGSEGAKMWDIVRSFVTPEQKDKVYRPEVHD